MAQAPHTAEQREPVARAAEKPSNEKLSKPQLVLVELGKLHSPKQIKRLRKGRGKLMKRIHSIVEELTEAGTVSAKAQPVVIIVREQAPLPWPFGAMPTDRYEDDDDDDEEED
jgi:Family of unknown function (DUF6200)